MNSKPIRSGIGKSLLAKDVYGMCFTARESLDCSRDCFFALRKNFLSHARKSVRINEKLVDRGLEGRVKGKMSGHSILWKKLVGKVAVEQSYDVPVGIMLVRRNFENMIVSKVFFDKTHHWIKSEYYNAPDAITAQVILKPVSLGDQVERFDYHAQLSGYTRVTLFPVRYQGEKASQRAVDAELGRPELILLTEDGEFSYTLEEDARKRLEMSELNLEEEENNILIWAEDNDAVSRAKADFVVSFTALDEHGKIEKKSSGTKKKNPPLETNLPEKEIVVDENIGNQVAEMSDNLESKNEEVDLEEKSFESKDTDLTEEKESLLAEESHENSENPASESEKPSDEQGDELPGTPASDDDNGLDILHKAEKAVEKRLAEQEGEYPILLDAKALLNRMKGNPVLKQVLKNELDKYFEPSKSPVVLHKSETDKVQEQVENKEKSKELSIENQLAQFVQTIEKNLGNQENSSAKKVPNPEKPNSLNRETVYRAAVVEGKITGISGVKKVLKKPKYEGEIKNGKRSGFGVSYSESGTLTYAGFWEDDKKSGLGISFRESDHAVHVANWSENKPDSFVSLFDTKGNLQYTGSIQDGQKEGLGISYRLEDGSVFVGKWEKGQPTGFGSVFDTHGHLIYTGMWKDGRRNGTGSEFNENGEVVFTGEWREDKHYNGVLYKRPSAKEE